MTNKFSKDSFTALILGIDDDKLEDTDLNEVIDRIIRKAVKSEDDDEDIEPKVAKAKKRMASFIAKSIGNEDSQLAVNPFFAIFLPLLFNTRPTITGGFGSRGIFENIPEDVFQNEYMPLCQKEGHYSTIITEIEKLTEENSRGMTVPPVIGTLFYVKDELLGFLKGRKEQLDDEMNKIIERYYPPKERTEAQN